MLDWNYEPGDDSDVENASDATMGDNVAETEVEAEPLSENMEMASETDIAEPEPEIAEDNGDAMLAIGLMAASEEPDLATVHSRDNPETIETLPNAEKEPIATIPLETEPEIEEESSDPPKDWRPGGPERG